MVDEKVVNGIALRLDRGVLVARPSDCRLTDLSRVQTIAETIRGEFGRAEIGVLVECSQLIYEVTSQFLGMLVRLRKEALDKNLSLGVCGLQGTLRDAFTVAQLMRIIPVFEGPESVFDNLAAFAPAARPPRGP